MTKRRHLLSIAKPPPRASDLSIPVTGAPAAPESVIIRGHEPRSAGPHPSRLVHPHAGGPVGGTRMAGGGVRRTSGARPRLRPAAAGRARRSARAGAAPPGPQPHAQRRAAGVVGAVRADGTGGRAVPQARRSAGRAADAPQARHAGGLRRRSLRADARRSSTWPRAARRRSRCLPAAASTASPGPPTASGSRSATPRTTPSSCGSVTAPAPSGASATCRLNPMLGSSLQWMPDQKTLLVKAIPDDAGPPPAEPIGAEGPSIQETDGQTGEFSTYEARDVLTNRADEARFEYYGTSQLELVDAGTGAVTRSRQAGRPERRRSRARRRAHPGHLDPQALLLRGDLRPLRARRRGLGPRRQRHASRPAAASPIACRSTASRPGRASTPGGPPNRPRWSGPRRSTAATGTPSCPRATR